MEEILDVVIIGAGPAGMSAAVYAKRAGLSLALLEKNYVNGGQIINTADVDNYLGIPGVSGFELGDKMREHCEKMGISTTVAEVTAITGDEIKEISLADGSTLKARNIVIATGARHRTLGVSGEDTFTGTGVSYCATCDGAFFKGKTVAVIGGGDTAVEDATYLARLCEKVYIVHRRDAFRAAKTLVDKLLSNPNVEFVKNAVVSKVNGSDKVESLTLKDVTDNHEYDLPVDGVFVAVGILPNTESFKGLVDMNEGGYIIASENCKTSDPHIFACGDVRTKPLRQVITAAADGANAINSMC